MLNYGLETGRWDETVEWNSSPVVRNSTGSETSLEPHDHCFSEVPPRNFPNAESLSHAVVSPELFRTTPLRCHDNFGSLSSSVFSTTLTCHRTSLTPPALRRPMQLFPSRLPSWSDEHRLSVPVNIGRGAARCTTSGGLRVPPVGKRRTTSSHRGTRIQCSRCPRSRPSGWRDHVQPGNARLLGEVGRTGVHRYYTGGSSQHFIVKYSG